MAKTCNESFQDRFDRIEAHVLPLIEAGWLGEYWFHYAKMISMQIRSSGCEPFSEGAYLADTFSGGSANGVADLANLEKRKIAYRLARKLQGALVRLPDWRLFRRLWSWSFDTRRAAHHGSIAALHYETLVAYAAELFDEQVRKYDLRSPAIYGTDRVLVGGRWLSFRTLLHFNTFLRLLDILPSKPSTILEIGAGSGELARIFLSSGFTKAYVIVDIPPTLAFSQELMIREFGTDRVSVFDPKRQTVDLSGERIVCSLLTPDQLHLVPAFDLGLNIASFGEMDAGIVSRYVDMLKVCGFEEFVSINQRIGKQGNRHKIGQLEYEQWMAPEYAVCNHFSFSAYLPKRKLEPDAPGQPGYQLLHFGRRR